MSLITGGLGGSAGSIFAALLANAVVPVDGGLDIQMSEPFNLFGPGANPASYIITGGGKAVTVKSVEIAGTVLRLKTTSHTDGANYFINFPDQGIVSVGGADFDGPFQIGYVGVATPVTIQIIRVLDARSIEIVFNKPADNASASNPANYTIVPTLQVTSVIKQTDYTWILKTSKQDEDETYNVTATVEEL